MEVAHGRHEPDRSALAARPGERLAQLGPGADDLHADGLRADHCRAISAVTSGREDPVPVPASEIPDGCVCWTSGEVSVPVGSTPVPGRGPRRSIERVSGCPASRIPAREGENRSNLRPETRSGWSGAELPSRRCRSTSSSASRAATASRSWSGPMWAGRPPTSSARSAARRRSSASCRLLCVRSQHQLTPNQKRRLEDKRGIDRGGAKERFKQQRAAERSAARRRGGS